MFQLLLHTAVKYRLSPEELPDRLCIILDMEFDRCVDNGAQANLDRARAHFAQYGYPLHPLMMDVLSNPRHAAITA